LAINQQSATENQKLLSILSPPTMPLSAGKKLGTCEILAPLGAGGMGEVYRVNCTWSKGCDKPA